MGLLKIVLNAIPLYYMSVLKLPLGFIKEMEGCMRGFLWGGVSGLRKIPWVAWEGICKGVRFGSLGVGFFVMEK